MRPPSGGVIRVHSAVHSWQPKKPGSSKTETEAFQAAIAEAERFLQIEMDYV